MFKLINGGIQLLIYNYESALRGFLTSTLDAHPHLAIVQPLVSDHEVHVLFQSRSEAQADYLP